MEKFKTDSTRPPNTTKTTRPLFWSERADNGYGQSRTEGTCATAASSHMQLSATSNIETSYSRLGIFLRPYLPVPFPTFLFDLIPPFFYIFSLNPSRLMAGLV